MDVVVIDFETRSMIPLEKVGAWKYSKHESTTVLCMAYKINDEDTRIIDFRQGFDIPTDLLNIIREGCIIEAFNVLFEWNVWSHILSERHKWPVIDISRFRCTQARAAQFSLPRSLQKVSLALEIGDGKDEEGRRVMLQMCKPKKPSKKDPSIWYDDDERYAKLLKYCKKDVDLTYKIRQKLLRLTKEKNYHISRFCKYKNKELQIFNLNNKINLRGIRCNIPAANHAVKLIEIHEQKLNSQLEDITEGRIKTANQVTEIVKYFQENGIHLDSVNKENVEKWLPRTKGVFHEVLKIRQQLSKSSVKKLQAMVDKADSEDKKIRDTVVYYGANRTGRFSGKGIQVQNLIVPTLSSEEIEEAIDMLNNKTSYYDFIERFPDFLDAVSSCVRGLLVPDSDKVFIDSDFSAIEARVLFWLAQDELGLELYNRGEDVYKDMASAIYDKPIEKVNKTNRKLGKTAILGLGYGMGKPKFLETCSNQGVEVSKELADKSVSTYRERYNKVPEFWRDVERSFIEAFCNPGRLIKLRNLGFVNCKEFLYIILPSGRALSYHFPDVQDRGWKKEITYFGGKKYDRIDTWGGKLVENIVQATARDFMAEAMLRIDEAYPIIFTVHDQLICETSLSIANCEYFNDLMVNLPEWADSCPIGAETKICRRFEK